MEIEKNGKKYRMVDYYEYLRLKNIYEIDNNLIALSNIEQMLSNVLHNTYSHSSKAKTALTEIIKHLFENQGVYGLKVNKAYIDEVFTRITLKHPRINILRITYDNYSDSDIIVMKDSDYMRINNVIVSDEELLKKCNIDYITKSPNDYISFLDNVKEVMQTNFISNKEYNIILPLLLSHRVNFQIYSNIHNNYAIIYDANDEETVLNLYYKSKGFDNTEKRGLIICRNIEKPNIDYFRKNIDLNVEKTKKLISGFSLCSATLVNRILSRSTFKVYYNSIFIGEYAKKRV